MRFTVAVGIASERAAQRDFDGDNSHGLSHNCRQFELFTAGLGGCFGLGGRPYSNGLLDPKCGTFEADS